MSLFDWLNDTSKWLKGDPVTVSKWLTGGTTNKVQPANTPKVGAIADPAEVAKTKQQVYDSTPAGIRRPLEQKLPPTFSGYIQQNMPGMNNGNGNSGQSALQQQLSSLANLPGNSYNRSADVDAAIQQLTGAVNQKYSLDTDNPIYQGLLAAYDKMSGAVDQAESKSNQNYDRSAAIVKQLFGNAVNDINTKDRKAVTDISNDYANSVNSNYNNTISDIKRGNARDMAEQAEMMKRYGLNEGQIAQPTESNELVQSLQANKASAGEQAATYKNADLARNTAMAGAVGAEGTQRQTDLRMQLDSILGSLNDKRNDIEVNKQGSLMDYQNQDYDRYAQAINNAQTQLRGYYNDEQQAQSSAQNSLYQMQQDVINSNLRTQENEAKSAASAQEKAVGNNSMFDVIGNKYGAESFDPTLALYNEARVSGKAYNATVDGNRSDFILRRMKEIADSKGVAFNPNIAGQIIDSLDNYGTDKIRAS